MRAPTQHVLLDLLQTNSTAAQLRPPPGESRSHSWLGCHRPPAQNVREPGVPARSPPGNHRQLRHHPQTRLQRLPRVKSAGPERSAVSAGSRIRPTQSPHLPAPHVMRQQIKPAPYSITWYGCTPPRAARVWPGFRYANCKPPPLGHRSRQQPPAGASRHPRAQTAEAKTRFQILQHIPLLVVQVPRHLRERQLQRLLKRHAMV